MGYLHINNLYREPNLLLFREVWALEKVHGTSAHIGCSPKRGVFFFAGGTKHEEFVKLFSPEVVERMAKVDLTVYGEAYGGKCQRMSGTYGKELRFIAFDVQIGDLWLAVPQAAEIVAGLGLEFVPYEKCSTDLAALDALRDRPSEVAKRRGIADDKPREGIVIRPLVEMRTNNGARVIAKHKGESFAERKHQPKPGQSIEVLQAAEAIAMEWVTPMRLDHILGRGIECTDTNIGKLIGLMIEDVEREGAGEIVVSREARKAIGVATAKLVKDRLKNALNTIDK